MLVVFEWVFEGEGDRVLRFEIMLLVGFLGIGKIVVINEVYKLIIV